MTIEACIDRQTNSLAIFFTQDNALGLRDGLGLKDLPHFLIAHPGCCAIRSLFAYRKASGVIRFPSEAVMQLYVGSEPATGK